MKIRIPVAVVLIAGLCAAALQALQAPQPPQVPSTPEPPPPTFRVEINYVEVDAIVTDAQGNPVTDLTVEDFQVLEDGRPQTVTAFSLVNLPIERAARPLFADAPIEPDVQTNTSAEGRIYLIVLDDLHTTFSNTPRVKGALRDFFERHFGDNDLAALVFTGGMGADGQDFTNNRRLLLEAADRFIGRKLRTEALDVIDRPTGPDPGRSVTDPSEQERAFQARRAMASVRRLADFMGGVRGRRKALLFVSEGISYDIFDVFRNPSANTILGDTAEAVGAATRANVAIYALDPRGLAGFDEAIEAASSPDASDPSSARSARDRVLLSQQSLRVLAEETGGFAAINRNDFSDAFARVVRENSTYYLLGFYPTNERRDGRRRGLEVRVKRPGVTVRARRGYLAPRGRAPAPRAGAANPTVAAASEALGSPIPTVGIPMQAFAAAYKGTAPNASIVLALELDAAEFTFADKDGTLVNRLEVSFTAIDRRGEARGGNRHTVTMTMRPETVARARERGFRVVSQVDLPPGRYQLRLAAAEEGAALVGSVLYDLEVPDFYAPPFTMSGVSLTSAITSATPTVRASDPLRDFLSGPPTTQREFDNDDQIQLFAEFYENARNLPPHTLDLRTTVRAEDGRVVFEDVDQRSSADLQGASGGHGYAVAIPLEALAPGTYVIRVEGRSRAAGADATVGRDVVIRIR